MSDFTLTLPTLSPPPSPSASNPSFSLPSLPTSTLPSQSCSSQPSSKPLSLNSFLSLPPSSGPSSSEAELPPDPNPNFRRKRKRRSRIARPRDSMPGFSTRRRHAGSARGRFKSQFRAAGAPGGSSHLNRNTSARAYFGNHPHEMDVSKQEMMAQDLPPPLCIVHAKPCVRLVCKRGSNRGREFFKCARSGVEQCPFFKWADQIDDVASGDDDDGGGLEEGKRSVLAPVFPISDEQELQPQLENALSLLGHDAFRNGQLQAVTQLHSRSVLAVMPTGAGKTLIYQLHAAVTEGMVLVVVPLVSLMLQQCAAMPSVFATESLRSGLSLDQIACVEKKVRNGEVKVLFITPERLFSNRFRRLMNHPQTPMVSLVVVDEAHCISQWSHNFRTAYLRIPIALFGGNAVLKDSARVLALTATATEETKRSICERLRIEKEGVVVCETRRKHLTLTLSKADVRLETKAAQLIRLFKTQRYAEILGIENEATAKKAPRAGMQETDDVEEDDDDECEAPRKRQRLPSKRPRSKSINDDNIGWGSNLHVTKRIRARRTTPKPQGCIIVYVSKQRDCLCLVNFLKSSALQLSKNIAMYHAGMSGKERARTQKQFEKGTIAVLVATVAFGMGLNYQRVRGVVHFDLPSSLEAYSQEIGRAGRSGQASFCRVLFNAYDANRMVSRSFADAVDEVAVRRMVRLMMKNKFQRRPLRQAALRMAAAGTGIDQQKASSSESEEEAQQSQEGSQEPTKWVLTVSERELTHELDLKCETGETVMAILEGELEGLKLRRKASTKLCISFFSKTAESLLKSSAASLTPIDRLTLQTICIHAKEKKGKYALDLSQARVTEDQVIGSLRRLQDGGHITFETIESAFQVECDDEAMEELERDGAQWARTVYEELKRIDENKTRKAKKVVDTLRAAGDIETEEEQSAFLHSAIEAYFTSGTNTNTAVAVEAKTSREDASKVEERAARLKGVFEGLIEEEGYGHRPETARQMARIVHGIDYGRFRARDWCRYRYWGSLVSHDFVDTLRIAGEVVRERHGRRRGR